MSGADTTDAPAGAAGGHGRRFWLALGALVLGAIAMGISPVFVRLADVGPFASAFWRVALALPFLYLWMRIEERGRAGPAPGWTGPVWLAGLLFAGDLFFWHLAIVNTTVANATFFASTAPVWVVLCGALLLGERARRADLAGLGLCLAGGAALIGESVRVDPARVEGDLYGLATAFFFGTYVLAVGRARATHGAARLIFRTTLVTAVALFAVALALEATIWPASLFGLAMLVALALLSQVGGHGLFAFALGTLPTVFSSLVIFIEAVAAAAFGWLFFAEALSAVQTAGGLLILAGLWIARPRGAGAATPGP